MRSFEDDLRTLTANFATTLILAVKRAALEEVARVVAEAEAESRSGRKSPRKRAPSSAPEKPRGRGKGAVSDRLLDYVREHPGERSENVRAALGVTRSQMQVLVKKLLADGKLRGEGNRRATRYFLR
jgi:hypothetical protein